MLLLLGSAGLTLAALAPIPSKSATLTVNADVCLVRPLGDEPTEQELDFLNRADGKSQRVVRQRLGDPRCGYLAFGKGDTDEEATHEGRAVWEYDWANGARCFVYFRGGVVEGTWYLGPNEIGQYPCD
jgi:hypothetical protein